MAERIITRPQLLGGLSIGLMLLFFVYDAHSDRNRIVAAVGVAVAFFGLGWQWREYRQQKAN